LPSTNTSFVSESNTVGMWSSLNCSAGQATRPDAQQHQQHAAPPAPPPPTLRPATAMGPNCVHKNAIPARCTRNAVVAGRTSNVGCKQAGLADSTCGQHEAAAQAGSASDVLNHTTATSATVDTPAHASPSPQTTSLSCVGLSSIRAEARLAPRDLGRASRCVKSAALCI
jgi:hypothetical protein